MSCMVVCIALGIDFFLNGSLPPLIYPGGQGYMNPSPILAKESYPSITRVVSSVPTSFFSYSYE
jgi:hypothetical protein